MVRVRLVNGRTLWLQDVVDEDDDEWLRATSSRGRDLLSRAWVKAVEAA